MVLCIGAAGMQPATLSTYTKYAEDNGIGAV
jgi:hypothetical protein